MAPLRKRRTGTYPHHTGFHILVPAVIGAPEDLSDPVYPELSQKFTEKEISLFFYIGGNDSMDTVSKLSATQQQSEVISA